VKEKVKIPRRRGRPASAEPYTAILHIQITARQKAWIDDVAARERRTIAQIVRRVLFDEPMGRRS
jgi:hypothetical protein